MTTVATPPALAAFHPVIASWFATRVGTPTDVQAKAWPEIAAGRHVLVTAPTGSGKTLTAFLWALDRLLTGAWEGGATRVLYVSPLKALNNDVRRNLLTPLAQLEEAFAAAGQEFQPVRVATRSGDTPQNERQKMIRRPPEILITTPESLNILLTSKGGRSILGGLATVVLDEIHAVASGKRGAHLMTAVERLVPLSGEFQRIALSATVRPLKRVARFVGGWEVVRPGEGEVDGGAGENAPRADSAEGEHGEAEAGEDDAALDHDDALETSFRPRRVQIVRSAETKRYDLEVAFPPEAVAAIAASDGELDALALDRAPDTLWEALAAEFKRRIRKNRSTLLFANSRRKTELITRLLNDGVGGGELAYSHHGSLARELRAVVEKRLKEGRLKAIVATSSLELGIDIGALDEVILLETPPSVASTVQRLGRAGHQVGETSRGRLYPVYGRDFLDAAVVARAVIDQEIEEVRPVVGALDVLAQVILSMVANETWEIDRLYDAVRASYTYHDLTRRQFELVLEMLAGRYAATRVRELEPRISIDRIAGTLRGKAGAARLVYLSGGTIPDRGYFAIRLADSMARIGELDEEFVWERSLGDSFTLGAQSWRIVKVTHNDVLVTPARRAAPMAPFWRAEARNRSFHLSEKIGAFLEVADETLAASKGAEKLTRRLVEHHAMSKEAAAKLVELLEAQRAAGGVLPTARRLLVERYRDQSEGGEKDQVVFHTFWGGRVNRPWAMAMSAAWEKRHGYPLEVVSDNDAIAAAVPRDVQAEELLELVRPDNVEKLLRTRLEATGFFGARFRENAGRALLLPRASFRRRVPLWLIRERAKKLLSAVTRQEDFPIVVETWRTCLQDEFELEPLKRLLGELAGGQIAVAETRTQSPSPFAAGLVWQQTNRLMYEDDVPEGGRGPGLSEGLLRELVFAGSLRPRLPAELLDRFQRKLHRTWPGYAPRTAVELVDWVKERLLVPEEEWRELLAAVERDLTEGKGSAGVDETEGQPRMVGAAGAEEGAGVGARREQSATDSGREDGGEGARGGAVGAAGAEELREMLAVAAERIVRVELPDAAEGSPALHAVVAIETLPRLFEALELEAGDVPVRAIDGTEREGDEVGATAAEVLERSGLPTGRHAGPATDDPLTALVGEWIRFYGPIQRQRLETAFGLGPARVREVLDGLVESETVVIDRFRAMPGEGEDEGPPDAGATAATVQVDEAPIEICDAENLERLLRILRAAARPEIETRPLAELPLFLATMQGLAEPGGGVADLQLALERLLGYPAPAGLWERELLPARLDPYYPAWLDSVMQESELLWLGCGRERLTFAFPEEVELLAEPGGNGASASQEAESDRRGTEAAASADGVAPSSDAASAAQPVAEPAGAAAADARPAAGREASGGEDVVDLGVDRLFPDPTGRFSLDDLAQHTSRPAGELTSRLWQLAWRGEVSNTTFLAVRKGVLARFHPEPEPAVGRSPGRSSRRGAGRRFGRWKSGRTSAGDWFLLAATDGEEPEELDAIDLEERSKERVRLLLDRYGVLFRELLARELPAMAWSKVFRSLRLMELSGEVFSGHFFAGIYGVQFASRRALKRLRRGLSGDAVWWVNALDPASPCGLGLDALRGEVPPRVPSNHLVFHGPRRVVTSRRNGSELEIEVGPDHPELARYLEFLRVLLTRRFDPLAAIDVETINGEPALGSPYARPIAERFAATRELQSLRLRRRY